MEKQNDNNMHISYLIHEASQARAEKRERRLLIALVIVIIVMLINNMMWLYAWNNYDYISEQEQVNVDAQDGVANYIGNDGDITNGADNSCEKEEK